MIRLTILLFALALPATAQLSGVYSINPMFPAGGTNFQTINAALAALHSQGLAGPTTMQLYDDGGPWTEANPIFTNITFGTAVLSVRCNLISGLSATNRLTFESAPGEMPVLDAVGQAFGIMLHAAHHVTIRGLEVKNAASDGISLYTDSNGGATSDLQGNEIIGCRIHDIGGCGINTYQNGGAAIAFDGTIMRNNFFWRCQMTNGGINNTWRLGYINERRAKNAIIENNTLYADTGVGSNFGVYVTYYAAPIGGPAASFRNNVIVKTVANGAVIRHVEANGMPQVQDYNVYEDQSNGVFLAGASGTAATFAAFQTTYAPRDANGLTGPVLLVNPSIGDLHLGTGSVAIDAGTTIPAVFDDIDGEARPIGPAYDAGADEAGSNVPAIIAYGSGCGGLTGAPALSAAQLPSLGNFAFTLDVTQATPNSQAYLFVALGPQNPPIPLGGGCNLHLDAVSMQLLILAGFGPFGPLSTGAAGATSFPMPVPNEPTLAGVSIFFQAAIVDATTLLGLSLTNGVEAVLN